MYLENIKQPSDIKNMTIAELKVLAKEIRQEILNTVMVNGGHLASSLGAVEIIIAMHYCFDAPNDKFIFDVGHQCYAHKLLTGRYEQFKTLRTFGGISGFPKKEESIYDTANTGHSSTSLSIACGLTRSLLQQNSPNIVVSLIGDGALTGGLAYEALNDNINVNKKQIIILNDNSMSISENVGSTAKYLLKLHDSNAYKQLKSRAYNVVRGFNIDNSAKHMKFLYNAKNSVKYFLQGGMPFEQFGMRYFGPINGNDIEDLITAIQVAKQDTENCIIHVVTKKGYGYKPAEDDPATYHGYTPKTKSTSMQPTKKAVSFSNAFGESMKLIASLNNKVFAVTAAMREGTGLLSYSQMFPNRFCDVGIAEGHATTMCAGLALGGYKPYFAVYSSFLQRAYDNLIHDVCLQDLPVTFCIDRAGIVPSDGETHQGIYDVNYLRLVPNMTVFAPKCAKELEEVLKWSLQFNHPLAIRYPKGSVEQYGEVMPIELGKWDIIKKPQNKENNAVVILACGAVMVEQAVKMAELLNEQGVETEVVNARFVKPIDKAYLKGLDGKFVVTLEDNQLAGGFGSSVIEFFSDNNINAKVLRKGIEDNVLTQGSVAELLDMLKLDAKNLLPSVLQEYKQFVGKNYESWNLCQQKS